MTATKMPPLDLYFQHLVTREDDVHCEGVYIGSTTYQRPKDTPRSQVCLVRFRGWRLTEIPPNRRHHRYYTCSLCIIVPLLLDVPVSTQLETDPFRY